MKSTKQQKEEASKPSTKRKATRSTTDFKKSTSCSTAQHSNSKRAKEELHKKCGDSQEQVCSSLDKAATPVPAIKLPSIGHEHRAIPFPSAKIKLQLFPLDERIRIGLEKDGYNPHLELTLSAGKKISSVLRHLNNKWGCSNVALGEPVLFPFNIKLESLAAYRCWTLNDSCISAGDVHAAVGYPSVFRLRYGWVFNQQKSILIPSATSPLGCTQSGVPPEDCNILEASTPTKVVSEESKAVSVVEQPTIGAVEQLQLADPSNTEGQGLESTVSHASSLWFDSLSNISMGALLSEESLLGKGSMLYLRSNDGRLVSQPAQLVADSMDAFISNHLKNAEETAGNRSGFQPSPVVADSLDAFFANHLKNAPEEKSSKEELQPSQLVSDSFDASIAKYLRNAQECRTLSVPSSILDAEETCHSFAFKKPYSSKKEFLNDGRSYFAASSTQDPELKSNNSLKASEASDKQDGIADHKPELEAQCLKGLMNDENSLGFSKINWTDSMGPFDLSLSSQQMIRVTALASVNLSGNWVAML